MDQLDRTLGQFAYSKIDLTVSTLSQLPSPTKVLFFLYHFGDNYPGNLHLIIGNILIFCGHNFGLTKVSHMVQFSPVRSCMVHMFRYGPA